MGDWLYGMGVDLVVCIRPDCTGSCALGFESRFEGGHARETVEDPRRASLDIAPAPSPFPSLYPIPQAPHPPPCPSPAARPRCPYLE